MTASRGGGGLGGGSDGTLGLRPATENSVLFSLPGGPPESD